MSEMTDNQKDQLLKNVVKMLNGVTTVADLKGITSRQLEAVYNVGYGYYQAGRFDDAEKLFQLLCLIEHTGHKYWTSLGAARQAQKNFEKAIEAYATAALLDMHDPKPHYYSAECAIRLGNLDAAESGFKSVLALCPAGVGRNDFYRDRATKMMNVVKSLREKIGAQGEKGGV